MRPNNPHSDKPFNRFHLTWIPFSPWLNSLVMSAVKRSDASIPTDRNKSKTTKSSINLLLASLLAWRGLAEVASTMIWKSSNWTIGLEERRKQKELQHFYDKGTPMKKQAWNETGRCQLPRYLLQNKKPQFQANSTVNPQKEQMYNERTHWFEWRSMLQSNKSPGWITAHSWIR